MVSKILLVVGNWNRFSDKPHMELNLSTQVMRTDHFILVIMVTRSTQTTMGKWMERGEWCHIQATDQTHLNCGYMIIIIVMLLSGSSTAPVSVLVALLVTWIGMGMNIGMSLGDTRKKNQEPRSKIQIKKQKRKIKKMKNEKKSKKKIIYEYPIRLIGRGYFNRLSTRTRL